MNRLEALSASTVDIETAARGFVITKNETLLEPYYFGKNNFKHQFSELKFLTRDNLAQQQKLDTLNRLYLERLHLIDITIAEIKAEQLDANVIERRTFDGKLIQDLIRNVLKDLKQTEQALMSERAKLGSEASSVAKTTIIATGFIIALLWILFYLTYRRQIKSLSALEGVESHAKKITKTIAGIHANSDSVIGMVTTNGQLLEINKVCEDVWGYSPDEIKRQPIATLFHPDDMPATREASKTILEHGAIHNFVNRTICKNGDVKKYRGT